MIVGTTVKTISSGRLYWVCRGTTSSLSPFFLRWKMIAQNIAPQVMTPTTSAAIADHVHRCRICSACGVMPPGQPKRITSSMPHAVRNGTLRTASAATLSALRAPRRPGDARSRGVRLAVLGPLPAASHPSSHDRSARYSPGNFDFA